MKTNKRPYCKPQIEKVQLVVEEAMLVACKTATSVGPDSNAGYPHCRTGKTGCSVASS